jgi:hypothetical protein
MNERVYSGWRGVTDHLHILLAVSFEPVEGSLACRFNTGEPLIHVGVPEAKYQTLIHSPFAGSYYRKFIRSKYPCPYNDVAPKYKPEGDGPARKREKQAKERLAAVGEAKPIELTLFGEISGSQRKSGKPSRTI